MSCRCDGRPLDGLRDISCQVDLFNPLHGSAVFQRGQTQVMCTVTLDSLESALKMDAISMLIRYIKTMKLPHHFLFCIALFCLIILISALQCNARFYYSREISI